MLCEPSVSVLASVIRTGTASSVPTAVPEPVGASATASTVMACVPTRDAVEPSLSVVVTVTLIEMFASLLFGGVTRNVSSVARMSAAGPVMV
jgi:hypothetical protein